MTITTDPGTMTETVTTATGTREIDVTRLPWTSGLVEVPKGASAEEMLEVAGLNWDVRFSPLFRQEPVMLPITSVESDEAGYPTSREITVEVPHPDGDLVLVEATDIKDVIKDVNPPKVLGQVKSDYVITQNREAFAFADQLVHDGEGQWIAGGQLYDDKVVYGVMKLEGLQIQVDGRDPIDTYVIIRTSHNGGMGIQVYVTPIRLLCANMMTVATTEAKFKWSIRHVGTLQGRLQEARDTLKLTTKYVNDGFQRELDKLLNVSLTDERARAVVDDVIPNTRARRDLVIDQVMLAYHDDELNGYAGTGYGLLNAVTDVFDHTIKRRSPVSRLQEQLDGEGAHLRTAISRRLVRA